MIKYQVVGTIEGNDTILATFSHLEDAYKCVKLCSDKDGKDKFYINEIKTSFLCETNRFDAIKQLDRLYKERLNNDSSK